MAPLTWTPGVPLPGLPAPLPEPQAPAVHPAVVGSIAPGQTVGVQAHLPLVAEVGAFRTRLRDFLRSNEGRQSKLGPAGGGVVGDPRVQTRGQRAGAIVQPVRLGGRTYHIYFHADGKREVIAMPKTPAQPTGGTLAP